MTQRRLIYRIKGEFMAHQLNCSYFRILRYLHTCNIAVSFTDVPVDCYLSVSSLRIWTEKDELNITHDAFEDIEAWLKKSFVYASTGNQL